MESTTKMKFDEDDEAVEEEVQLERFDDFTLASSWERFISDIEAICRQWMADGPKNLLEKGAVHQASGKNLYKVKSELKYALKNYCVEFYFSTSTDGKPDDWNDASHCLQLSFGVDDFLVISPQSASGVVLDAPESSKLLSAVAIALSNCSSVWAAFVPVHDPSRKAFFGIQSMGTVFTRRFEADYIGSQVPVKLMHLEGVHELFISKFAYSMSDFAVHVFQVHFRMKLTYELLTSDDDEMVEQVDPEISEVGGSPKGDNNARTQWDDDCPWSEWYSAEDPVKGFQLIAIWKDRIVESSLEMAELENASPHEAEKWILSPKIPAVLWDGPGKTPGFARQLSLLVDALEMSFEVQFMEDFVSVERPGTDKLKSSMVVPPPTVVDRVLKELFQDGLRFPEPTRGENKNSRAIKGAPLQSLFTQFCLNSLWLGSCNIRAIAVLWIEFVREVRWCWEESQTLPRIPISGSIDLSTCLIHQKLQMLAICIDKKQQLNEEYHDCVEREDSVSVHSEEENGPAAVDTSILREHNEGTDGKHSSASSPRQSNLSRMDMQRISMKLKDMGTTSDFETPAHLRRGSAGVVGGMMLLKSYQGMHAPFTLEAPLMTEDMHEERLQAVDAFGDSVNFSAQLEKEILSSDMSAFKAANPDAVFEDFIRWHSPGDWENDESGESGSSSGHETAGSTNSWPPRGKLSSRMSEHGNLWRKIWNDAPALPASEQKPLLDPNREGEKVLHYLETIQPHKLLEQMVCTSFKAAADTLNQTSFGGLKQMTTKLDQLYLTMAPVLRSLQANRLSSGSEAIEDMRRLTVIFGQIERLLCLAASLHRKFLLVPAISEAIFSEYYKHHLKKMGNASMEAVDEKDFEMKLPMRNHERVVVLNMFNPPSANQSWRKVLSMGNLLNGHEPIVREIIFSKFDRVSGSHYAMRDPKGYQHDIETYRMYVCGTSNDLRVALSVASCD